MAPDATPSTTQPEGSGGLGRWGLLRLFAAFGLSYVACFPFQTINAVIAPDLVRDVGMDAGGVGFLTAVYLLSFAAFQIPLGLLLDRFGPRRVEGSLLVLAAVGAFVFARAETFAGLVAGRILIGIGVSACLMAAFKSFAMWLPASRVPFANSIQLTAGGIGAIAATVPVEMALEFIDWRTMFIVLGVLALLGSGLIFILVPEKQGTGKPEPARELLAGLKHILTDRRFWMIAPWGIAGQASFIALFGLWSGPWLRNVAGLDRLSAANGLMVMSAAMMVGYLLSGRLVEVLARRGIPAMRVAAWGMSTFVLVQVLLAVPWTGMPILLWGAFGFFGAFCILPYAILPGFFPGERSGRVITSLNLLVFGVAFFEQWLVGVIIDFWPAEAGISDPRGFTYGFGLLILAQVLGGLWYFSQSRTPALSASGKEAFNE